MLRQPTEKPDDTSDNESSINEGLVTAVCHYQNALELLNLELLRKEEELNRSIAKQERLKRLLVDASCIPTLFNPANRHFETGRPASEKCRKRRKRSNTL